VTCAFIFCLKLREMAFTAETVADVEPINFFECNLERAREALSYLWQVGRKIQTSPSQAAEATNA